MLVSDGADSQRGAAKHSRPNVVSTKVDGGHLGLCNNLTDEARVQCINQQHIDNRPRQ